jgi:hypothetical protein
VRRSSDGSVRSVLDLGIGEAHGLDALGGDELVAAVAWPARPPADPAATHGGVYRIDARDGSVRTFEFPQHTAYATTPFRPTAVRGGGPAGFWVADGYGASLVHAYDADGAYRSTLPSEVDGLVLACPHDLLVVEDRLLVTDRLNARIVAFSAGGAEVVVPPGTLDLPGALALDREGRLLVGELAGRISVFEPGSWRLVARVADGTAGRHAPGWPNGRAGDGTMIPPQLREGVLHAPHSIATDQHDGVWVTEWHTAGRLVTLRVS